MVEGVFKMTTREDSGCHDQLPHPSWCVGHIGNPKGREDFWHEGRPREVLTADALPNGEVIHLQTNLSQRILRDERGDRTEPVEIVVGESLLTPAGARLLASALVELADEAEWA
jgi:hypothetical protein